LPKHAKALGGVFPPCLGGRRFLGGQPRLDGQRRGLREDVEGSGASFRSCGAAEEWWTAGREEKHSWERKI
jgi:hypothetical protein